MGVTVVFISIGTEVKQTESVADKKDKIFCVLQAFYGFHYKNKTGEATKKSKAVIHKTMD